ncbi:MATE family efflux transporter [Nesterenkonia muleiensis]|uniref:MATE family efflux transporter n=1 Tax=Nesterenkonia muleiensis TaxID=2282648 RepID=UPI001EE485E5|nr:MATE family efflux transporter [Nesterenkonia muleiensis]
MKIFDPLNRQILRLALPTFIAVSVQPLFLLADGVMIGRLGVEALAGFGIASAVLQTVTGLMVFLVFSTTSRVARTMGAGRIDQAIAEGVTGIWFAVAIGGPVVIVGVFVFPGVLTLFNPTPAVHAEATAFMAVALFGIPASLLVYAATGLLRGLQNAVMPMVVSTVAFGINILLNWLFIYGFGQGVVGAAIGTLIAQWGMAIAYLAVIVRYARRSGVLLRPQTGRWTGAIQDGAWLLLRTAALRGALLGTVGVATALGTAELASWQIVFTVFSITGFVYDALAVASQALVGSGSGRNDKAYVAQVIRRIVAWGLWVGAVVGFLVGLSAGWIGILVFDDPLAASLVWPGLIVLAVTQPLFATVSILDGVLMGAGHMRYLAFSGVVILVPFAPLLVLPPLLSSGGEVGLTFLALAFFGVYMFLRLCTLVLRLRRNRETLGIG